MGIRCLPARALDFFTKVRCGCEYYARCWCVLKKQYCRKMHRLVSAGRRTAADLMFIFCWPTSNQLLSLWMGLCMTSPRNMPCCCLSLARARRREKLDSTLLLFDVSCGGYFIPVRCFKYQRNHFIGFTDITNAKVYVRKLF